MTHREPDTKGTPGFTPGPWEALTSGMDALVMCPDGRTFNIGDAIYHEQNKANARLIAAAPEMYEAGGGGDHGSQ